MASSLDSSELISTNPANGQEIARIATTTVMLAPGAAPVEEYVSEYHYQRKHGPGAWYGQKKA